MSLQLSQVDTVQGHRFHLSIALLTLSVAADVCAKFIAGAFGKNLFSETHLGFD